MAQDRHNSNKYSGRGCSGDSEGSDPWYQLEDSEPTKSKPVWAAASEYVFFLAFLDLFLARRCLDL